MLVVVQRRDATRSITNDIDGMNEGPCKTPIEKGQVREQQGESFLALPVHQHDEGQAEDGPSNRRLCR